MNNHYPCQPQRISLRYAIPSELLRRSISFAEVEAQEKLARTLVSYLIKDCMTKKFVTDGVQESTIFELNGYFVTPQALDRLVQDRVHKIQAGYPVVDFY